MMVKVSLILALAMVGTALAKEPDLAPLLKQFPQLKVRQIQVTPAEGFWELLTEEGQIYYITDTADYLFSGELVEVRTKGSLTEQRRQGLRREFLATMPVDVLRFEAEAQQYEVTIVTDIDCGYCRRLHQQIAEFNDLGVTINYLLMPRAGLNSESARKAQNAVCAKQPQVALTAAMAGETIERADCENSIAQQFNLAQKLGVTGTPTIVMQGGQVIPGYLTPAQLLARLQ